MMKKAVYAYDDVYWVKVGEDLYLAYERDTLKPRSTSPVHLGSIVAHTHGDIFNYACDIDFEEPVIEYPE